MKRLLALLIGLCLLPVSAGAQVIEYYHLDAVGNVRAVTNQQGQVIERHDYLPFGEEWNPQGGTQPLRFTGKERDAETGLDYFGARYYAAGIGRFTTVDPALTIQENISDPQRWNRYAYGRDNPLRFVDPDGRDWLYRLAMNTFYGPAYVQQFGDRSSFGAFFGAGWSSDIARAWPQFQEQMATDATIASLIGLIGEGLGGARPRGGQGVRANKAAGDAWSEAVGAELKATHEVAVPEITVRTQGGVRTRLDWVTKDSGGRIGCVECKASETAPLTRGQAAAHPEIAQTGAVVAGKGKPGIPGGTVIPPTRVEVRRQK